MISLKSNSSVIGASLLSALAASLCCITPVLALLAGSSSLAANFSWIEPARPYMIGLSIAVLSFAWHVKLKPSKQKNMDCCEPTKKPSFLQSKTFLGIITGIAILMMSFPLYAKLFYPNPKVQSVVAFNIAETKQVKFTIHGMTCAGCEVTVNTELSKVNGIMAYKTSYAGKSSLVTFDPSKVEVKTIEAAINKTGYEVKGYEVMNNTSANSNTSQVAFYKAPLVCEAAPTIGCGSKAKFMLVDFEKYSNEIEEAWLNRTGTLIAIIWKPGIEAGKKEGILKNVSTSHSIELTEVGSNDRSNEAKAFPKGWYRGKQVDKLSKEEAGIIAENTIKEYKKMGLIKPAFETKFRADIEKIYSHLFLSISSYKDLTETKYNEIEDKIQVAGEKYIGKGKMPKVELCTFGKESCEKDKSCSDDGKSCCDKQ